MEDQPTNKTTRHLHIEHMPPPQPKHGTGPLDYLVPWVVELRVVGTASVLHFRLKEQMLVGRGDKKQNNVPDIDLEGLNGYYLGVSRRHAIISALNSRVVVEDLNSSNGTFINGQRLESGRAYQLRHGDQIAFGKLALQVSFVVTPSSHEKNETAFTNIDIPVIGSGQRILVVDEDEQVTQTIGVVLQEAGFCVTSVNNVTEAMTQFDQSRPQAIVTEIVLSDRSGIDLLEYVRASEAGSEIPLIVVSSASGGYQMGQAIDAGADVFINKPVGVDELLRGFSKIVQQMG